VRGNPQAVRNPEHDIACFCECTFAARFVGGSFGPTLNTVLHTFVSVRLRQRLWAGASDLEGS